MITAGKARGNAQAAAAIHEQHGQVPTGAATALEGDCGALGCAPVPDDPFEFREQPAVQAFEEPERILVRRASEFPGERRHRLILVAALQIGLAQAIVRGMQDRQPHRLRQQDEIVRVVVQGADLHGHVDLEAIGPSLEPELGYPIPLQIEMQITADGVR